MLILELPPLTVVSLRVGLAAVGLWLFAFAIGLRPPKVTAVWMAFLMMGVLKNVIPFSLIVWGHTHITSGRASTLSATTPFYTVILAGIFLADERFATMKLTGVCVGFFGVVLMINPEALEVFGADLLAQLAIFGRRFLTMGIDPILTAAGQVTATSIILAPIALYVDMPFSLEAPGAEAVAAILLGALALGKSLELIHFLGMVPNGFGLSVIDGRL